MNEPITRLLLFVKQVRLALKPNANPVIVKSCLEGCDFAKEDLVEIKEIPLMLIQEWGGIDGAHHKQWLLDQLVRVMTTDYEKWVKEFEAGEDSPNTYSWDVGIAP